MEFGNSREKHVLDDNCLACWKMSRRERTTNQAHELERMTDVD